jgi:hypothetical protein
MAFLQINGVTMPTPSSLTAVASDFDSPSTRRNEQGYLQRYRIRQGVRKVSCKWSGLSQADATALLIAIRPASFSLTYPDPELGTNTINVYVGDRTPDMKHYNNGAPYWDIAFDFIQY